MTLCVSRTSFIAVCAALTCCVCLADDAPAKVDAPTNMASAQVAAATNSVPTNSAPVIAKPLRRAKITSDMTHYDRKEGMAIFTGHAFADDEQYQMHADKAYVFMTETNTLKRIVAIGHVALTNDLKCATGAKASYYKEGGMVVLYGGEGVNAEVSDASKGADKKQTLRGAKIKFWIDSEQVEVLDATIVAPVSSAGSVGLGGLR